MKSGEEKVEAWVRAVTVTLCMIALVGAMMAIMAAEAQEVKYCKHRVTGEIKVIPANRSCGAYYYEV